jgi:hypothetical protein
MGKLPAISMVMASIANCNKLPAITDRFAQLATLFG